MIVEVTIWAGALPVCRTVTDGAVSGGADCTSGCGAAVPQAASVAPPQTAAMSGPRPNRCGTLRSMQSTTARVLEIRRTSPA